MARCSKGHENPDSQRFCGECGEELRAPAAQAGSSQPGTDQDAASDLPSGPPQRPDEWRPGFTTPPPTPAAPPPSPPGRPVPRGNALAVAALAVGIVGV